MSTRDVQRLARENGLFFAPDPGAAEQSQIGGNVATNAGGPHALKYGVTGAWVAGLEAVLAPGELVQVGGWAGKDVAGYDLKSLLVGSEGTLGVITAVRLRLLPAPEARSRWSRSCARASRAARRSARCSRRGCARRCSTSWTARTLADPRAAPIHGPAACRRRARLRADRARWTARARRRRRSARRWWS